MSTLIVHLGIVHPRFCTRSSARGVLQRHIVAHPGFCTRVLHPVLRVNELCTHIDFAPDGVSHHQVASKLRGMRLRSMKLHVIRLRFGVAHYDHPTIYAETFGPIA